MKNLRIFFLTGTIVLFIIILIVAFQNIQAQCNFLTFFFYQVSTQTPPTIIIFVVALLGIFAGMLLMGLLMSLFSKGEEDEDF